MVTGLGCTASDVVTVEYAWLVGGSVIPGSPIVNVAAASGMIAHSCVLNQMSTETSTSLVGVTQQ